MYRALACMLKPLKHEMSVLVWGVGGGIPFEFKPPCRIIERLGYLCWRLTRDPQNCFLSTRPEPVSEFQSYVRLSDAAGSPYCHGCWP